jgi:hypothetical protein
MTQYEWEPAGSHNPWGRKRVRRTHCLKGHEFTDENTFIRAHDKARVCRECRKQYAREKYQRNKAANNGVAVQKKQKPKYIDFGDLYPMADNVRILWYNLQARMKGIVTPCQDVESNTQLYSGDLSHQVTTDQAEALCHGCPIIMECYRYADAADESWGIWGGVNFSKEELINVDEQ